MAGNGAGTGTALPCSHRKGPAQLCPAPLHGAATCSSQASDRPPACVLAATAPDRTFSMWLPREMDPEVQQPIASQWQRSGLINTAALQEARAAAILSSLEIIPFTTSSVAFAAS